MRCQVHWGQCQHVFGQLVLGQPSYAFLDVSVPGAVGVLLQLNVRADIHCHVRGYDIVLEPIVECKMVSCSGTVPMM